MSRKALKILLALLGFVILGLILLHLHIKAQGQGHFKPKHQVGVVFGAAVRNSGELFGAILYRTQTAVRLYHQGRIRKILFSGSDRGYTQMGEASAMWLYARRHGVPEKDILVDNKGHNTLKTIQNSKKILSKHNTTNQQWAKTLFISQDYHLARIRFLARRYGFHGYTYPAQNKVPLQKETFFELRELLAYLYYYTRHWPEITEQQ